MKKLILTSALIAFVAILQAQWFVGGTFGYSYRSVSETRTNEFSVLPMFGYQWNNRLTVGSNVGFVGHTISRPFCCSSREVTRTTLWGIQPFVRHTIAEFGDFSVLANFRLHYFVGRSYFANLWDDPSAYSFGSRGINVVPILSYSVSEMFRIEATFNFMSLGWNRNSSPGFVERNFGIGSNPKHLVDVGLISIGFIYKFRGTEREAGAIKVRTSTPRRSITVPGLE